MEIQAPFGFVTGCFSGDLPFVGATLASIKRFCPDSPICLVVDGDDVDVTLFERIYDVIVLRISELDDPFMRSLLSGTPRSKMAAVWFGPFESLIWLDSDAVIWGDIREDLVPEADFQVFREEETEPHKVSKDEYNLFSHFYFRPDRLREVAPDFDWTLGTYFCAGAFAAKRNAISMADWIFLERKFENCLREVFFFDQGIINFLVNKGMQSQALNVAFKGTQYLPIEFGMEGIDSAMEGLRVPDRIDKPMIVHFCGKKPWIQNGWSFARIFTSFRIEHQRNLGKGLLLGWASLLQEEITILIPRLKRRIGRAIGRLVK